MTQIVTFINQAGKINFDESINNKFCYPKDFSKQAFNSYLKAVGIDDSFSIIDLLLSLNAAIETDDKGVKLTNAGVLFFSDEPQKFIPESYITAVCYKSEDRFSIIDKKDFYGPLLEQIDNSLSFIMRNMNVEYSITKSSDKLSAKRQELYDYPYEALREAVVNAVTHRDYFYDASHIYIHMYPNRIEIENPGGLYKGLTIENLGKRSIRRNRLVADLLHRAGFIERVGSGFDRMEVALKINNNPDLEVSASNFFNIKFYKRIIDERVAMLSARQRKLLELFEEHNVLSKRDAAILLDTSEDTTIREIKNLVSHNLVKQIGTGRATRYEFVSL